MTRKYTLAPFKASNTSPNTLEPMEEIWAAQTTLYNMDLNCDNDCGFGLGIEGNDTIGDDADRSSVSKEYTGWLPPGVTHTFYAAYARNKNKAEDPGNNITAIYCTPFYYSQQVNATIDVATKRPQNVVPLGPKRELDAEIYSTTLFESQLRSSASKKAIRGALPTTSFPSYLERLARTKMSLAGMAFAAGKQPAERYLDHEALGKSYEVAMRLLFLGSMVDVLDQKFSKTTEAAGQREITTQAVMLVPLFTYIVEGLLGLISFAALVLLYNSPMRASRLRSDPSTIASVMSLAADSEPLLLDFQNLDCCTTSEVGLKLRDRRFKLINDESRIG
ncbi:hypothetical protein BCR34DRAFT_607381 [Clohesyomyces aquaticus]|uniref:Uncharacterized protein n=1 Tax=Clohesyomyces aquaticus TaxID=1231657 RepID=A0A1Y1YGU9_9PLEO|nr:hypothetical protein BCR34DRAFT_607381 [Clohesyomyces aquaticus]